MYLFLATLFRVILIFWAAAIIVMGLSYSAKFVKDFINSKRKIGIDSGGKLHYMKKKELKHYRRTHKNIVSRMV